MSTPALLEKAFTLIQTPYTSEIIGAAGEISGDGHART